MSKKIARTSLLTAVLMAHAAYCADHSNNEPVSLRTLGVEAPTLEGAQVLQPQPEAFADFGILDTQHIDLARHIDAEYLRSLENRSGETFADIIQEIDAMLRAENRYTDPDMAVMMAPPTNEVYVDDPVSGVIEWRRHTEKAPAPPGVVGAPGGHGLAIEAWDNALGWTEEGLEESTTRQITAHVQGVATGLRRRHRREFLRRLFGNHQQKIDKNTNGLSPGFAGSGTDLNVFSPGAYPDGYALPDGYSHYFRTTSDPTALRTAIKTAKRQLNKWLGSGNWEIWPSREAAGILAGLTGDAMVGEDKFFGFIAASAPLIIASPNDARAQVDPAVHLGVLDGDIRVRKPFEDFGGAYFVIYRTNGNFAEGNPMVWRYDALRGRGAFLRSRASYPLAHAIMLQWFGININNRVGAAIFQIVAGAGSFTPPTIPA
jgi:hypothetical protein